jgi:hypothetical protein
VGRAVLDAEAEATLIVIVSLAPDAGVKVDADSVVVLDISPEEELVAGHAESRL